MLMDVSRLKEQVNKAFDSFKKKMADTFENVCCNIRNVKSNYLKCIPSQCLSPPCVFFFTYETSMAEEQKSLKAYATGCLHKMNSAKT